MGDEAEALTDFLSDIPTGRQIARKLVSRMNPSVLCVHELIIDWCAICKHTDHESVKVVLLRENLKIVENLLSWQKKKPTT